MAKKKAQSKKAGSKKAAAKKTSAKKPAVTWAAAAPGDWDYDPNEDPKWMDPATPRRRIETDEQYKLVAHHIVKVKPLKIAGKDEVVNDEGEVVGVVVDDLRKLIDAVQAHKEARLVSEAKPHEDPTKLSLQLCTIAACDLSSCDIGINLGISSQFKGPASFDSVCFKAQVDFFVTIFMSWVSFDLAIFNHEAEFFATKFQSSTSFDSTVFKGGVSFNAANFRSIAWFSGANFLSEAWFDSASFASMASFNSASFEGQAQFGTASFGGDASFDSASFRAEVWFGSASFEDTTSFFLASFKGEASFASASFGGRASFGSASFKGPTAFVGASISDLLDLTGVEIEHRLILGGHGIQDATFSTDAVLRLNNVIPRTGGSIEFSKEQLLRLETNQQTLRRKGCLGIRAHEPWARRHAMLDRLLRRLWPDHSILGLGLIARHNLIEGEARDQWVFSDTDPLKDRPTPLDEAARTYNLLRDVFRNQPSTDELEDICIIRHQDLVRRSWDDGTRRAKLKIFFHWLVMRNMLGYLIVPTRIIMTSLLLVFICGLIYAVFASDAPTGATVIPDQNIPMPEGVLERAKFGLYFSLTTFVTLGYGDYSPTGWFKLLTGAQAFLGVTLLALFTVAWGRKMIR